MARTVSVAEQVNVIELMMETDEMGNFLFGQREIERQTGLSRPFIRKLAREIGHQFPRTGIEIIGQLCLCANCGMFFRRPLSKVLRAKKNNFCDPICQQAFSKGSNHPSWKQGKYSNTWSKYVKNQTAYKEWRAAVLEKAGNKCEVSGRSDNLECHHIFMKAEGESPELAFDVKNGMVLNDKIHREIHKLITRGFGCEEAIKHLKEKYKQEKEDNNENSNNHRT